MLGLIGRRLALSLPLLVIVPTVTFLLAALIPGDVARTILGADASQAQVGQLRQALGLNQPLAVRYWQWLAHAVHGNLGTSLFWQQPVVSLLDSRLPVTLSLVVGSTLVAASAGAVLGTVAALHAGALGRAVDAIALAGLAIPNFFLGLLLISWFAASYREDFAQRHETAAGPAGFGIAWRDNMRYIWQQYVPDPALRRDADASPMRAASLAGLAPAFLITAERDILRAETERYARRLAGDGVPVQLRHYPGADHGFFHLLAATADARDAVARAAAALRQAFSERPAGRQRPRRAEPEGSARPAPRISLCTMSA